MLRLSEIIFNETFMLNGQDVYTVQYPQPSFRATPTQHYIMLKSGKKCGR